MKFLTILPLAAILTLACLASYVAGGMPQPSPEEKTQAEFQLALSALSEKADALPDSPEKVRVIKGLTILEAVKF
jgi:hypothetical protein